MVEHLRNTPLQPFQGQHAAGWRTPSLSWVSQRSECISRFFFFMRALASLRQNASVPVSAAVACPPRPLSAKHRRCAAQTQTQQRAALSLAPSLHHNLLLTCLGHARPLYDSTTCLRACAHDTNQISRIKPTPCTQAYTYAQQGERPRARQAPDTAMGGGFSTALSDARRPHRDEQLLAPAGGAGAEARGAAGRHGCQVAQVGQVADAPTGRPGRLQPRVHRAVDAPAHLPQRIQRRIYLRAAVTRRNLFACNAARTTDPKCLQMS